MAEIIDRTQLRVETERLDRSSNVSLEEAAHATLRRVSEGDYRVAIDDVAILAATVTEGNETQTKLEEVRQATVTEGNETQTKLEEVRQAVVTEGNETQAALTNGSQKSQLVDAGGEAATVSSGRLDVNATMTTAQFNQLMAKLDEVITSNHETRDAVLSLDIGV